MDTALLKSFATKARTDLIKEVGARVTVALSENSLARVESAPAVRALEEAIASDGRERVIDRVAYTWFNRIIAFRFMDVNGYTQSGVVSPESGRAIGQPEVLAEAKAGTFDSAVVPLKTRETITRLLNGTRPSQDAQGEAYGMLLEAYCRSWHKTMPFMFEREGDYTELLIPTALLSEGSVRDQAVKTLAKEACNEVEVIGWLYQFYISERKDEVFQGFKKNKKAGAAEIPAATQLFTPHWIVRYLVENSLGRLWLLNNPTSRLAEQMDYYIKPVDTETDFLRITKPEELKIIDPAVGSGHMLTYAFDMLYAIYTEKGYDPAEIPGLILQHNLFGIEIDPRAGALAAFALTMKAAEKRKLFLKSPVQPNIRVLENVHFDAAELDYLWSLTKGNGFARGDVDEFWNAFEHADTFGSLIRPNAQLFAQMKAVIDEGKADGDLFQEKVVEKATAVVANAEYLTREYAIAVANPPYMGSKQMNALLSQFMKDKYPNSKSDLFAGFIERCLKFAKFGGQLGLMTPYVWMFIKSYEPLRKLLLTEDTITSLIQLEYSGFDGATVPICTFTIQRGPNSEYEGGYVRLSDFIGPRIQAPKALEAIQDQTKSWFYRAKRNDFASIPGSPI
ncbi:MAG: BREX-1 system adenine-specific DNA-methyltransferase PglX, partial [Cryobacterium sp.]|nr:BREX-1 system adenine-specific DNA-methyltransferase PglX [Cryobacterium sp.]